MQDRTPPSRMKGLRVTVLVMAQPVHVTLTVQFSVSCSWLLRNTEMY